ncbi:GMP synthase [Daphnia magna]|uniref:GMP synthase n=1 Tax=Daphnia magna TaxID=35525 RepID=A0A164E804_9CRUS|nr:GMP synthase [Daphnia magna]
MPTWERRNMPCSIGLKSRRRKKRVFFWKNCPVATSMLPRYCLFAPSVFRYKSFATRGPHSVQEVPDRVRPGRKFAIESRKPFVLTAKLTTYPCRMKAKCEVIIPIK